MMSRHVSPGDTPGESLGVSHRTRTRTPINPPSADHVRLSAPFAYAPVADVDPQVQTVSRARRCAQ